VTLLPSRLVVGEGPSESLGQQRQQWMTPPVAGAVAAGFVTFF
jgi:hypothetical protein